VIIQLYELACENRCELAAGLLSRKAGGIVSLIGAKDTSWHKDPKLDDYDDLVVGALGDWFVALGERSSLLLVGDSCASVPLRVGGIVSRLALDDCYDPGGLERVKYFSVDEESCLIETEMGFWRFSRSDGIMWSVVHDNLTLRIKEVLQDKIVVYDEDGTHQFSVADGSQL